MKLAADDKNSTVMGDIQRGEELEPQICRIRKGKRYLSACEDATARVDKMYDYTASKIFDETEKLYLKMDDLMEKVFPEDFFKDLYEDKDRLPPTELGQPGYDEYGALEEVF